VNLSHSVSKARYPQPKGNAIQHALPLLNQHSTWPPRAEREGRPRDRRIHNDRDMTRQDMTSELPRATSKEAVPAPRNASLTLWCARHAIHYACPALDCERRHLYILYCTSEYNFTSVSHQCFVADLRGKKGINYYLLLERTDCCRGRLRRLETSKSSLVFRSAKPRARNLSLPSIIRRAT
jgi:hypothetical protein